MEAIKEIKLKFKWSLDYENLSDTQDILRTVALIKLTQVQRFLLAVRDMERMQGIPYELSMVKDNSNWFFWLSTIELRNGAPIAQ